MVAVQKESTHNSSLGGIKSPHSDTAVVETTSKVAKEYIAFLNEGKGGDVSLQDRGTEVTLEDVDKMIDKKSKELTDELSAECEKALEEYTRKQSPIGRLIDRIVSWVESKQNFSTGGIKSPPSDTVIVKTTSEVAKGSIVSIKKEKGDDASLKGRVTIATLEEVGKGMEEKLDKRIEEHTCNQPAIYRLIDLVQRLIERIVHWIKSQFSSAINFAASYSAKKDRCSLTCSPS